MEQRRAALWKARRVNAVSGEQTDIHLPPLESDNNETYLVAHASSTEVSTHANDIDSATVAALQQAAPEKQQLVLSTMRDAVQAAAQQK